MKIDHKDMETIESFKSIYQAYLESNLTVRDLAELLPYALEAKGILKK